VSQFETPKAFANFSPAVGAQRQPWGFKIEIIFNPEKGSPGIKPFEGVRRLANPFQGVRPAGRSY